MGKAKKVERCRGKHTDQKKTMHLKTKAKQQRSKRGKCLNWLNESMTAAVNEVMSGRMSQRMASKVYGVPRCTLHTRVTGKTEIGAKPGHPTKLSFDQEKKLVDYASNRAELGIGFGKRPFLNYAHQFAEKHSVRFDKRVPSEHWWSGMKKRHPELRLRQPEGTASVRHRCMDPVKVAKYFHVMKQVLEEHSLKDSGSRICNMDESGV